MRQLILNILFLLITVHLFSQQHSYFNYDVKEGLAGSTVCWIS
jgi:hypothetical protein